MGWIKAVLILTGLVFLGFGIAFLVDPEALAKAARLRLAQPRAYAEIRAMYGGLEVGLGLFFLVASQRTRWFRAALGAQVFALFGLAGGRLIGMIQLPAFDGLMMTFFVIEAIGGVIGLITFRYAKEVLLNNNYRAP